MHEMDKEDRNISSNSVAVAVYSLNSATHYMEFD